MSTFMLFAVFVVALIVSLAIFAISLWLLARVFRVPNISMGRAVATALLVAAVNLATQGAYFGFSVAAAVSATAQAFAALAMLILGLYVAYSIVKRMFRLKTGRAVALFVAALVVNTASGLGGAFLIRAKICEAFVVPTGAEALAIYGQHFDLHCTNCGYRYAITVATDDQEPAIARNPMQTTCPNCGQENWMARGTTAAGGDHIMVDKTTAPRRWDIVAFKSPTQPNTNYVKRIVALPGEKLAFSGGHVFINGRETHRRPDEEMDLWVPVNDSRFYPTSLATGAIPWHAGDGSHWTSKAAEWSCQAADNDELQFNGAITNSLAYNQPFKGAGILPEPHPVGDIKLDCSIGEFAGDGSIGFHWAFAGQRFDAVVAASGEATLVAIPTGGDQKPSHAECKLSRPLRADEQITFAVRDGLGYLCENGKSLASVTIESDEFNPDEAKPESSNEKPCHLTISAKHCNAKLSRITLSRDTYFEARSEEFRPLGLNGMRGPGPFQLGDDEYCVIGDNVSLSMDSRDFGPIKRGAIIGVARWVYWPPSRWHTFQ